MKYSIKILAMSVGIAVSSLGLALPFMISPHTPLIASANFINHSMLAVDTDKDGKVDRAEFATGDDRILVIARNALPSDKLVVKATEVDILEPSKLASLDKNQDGRLNKSELQQVYLAQAAAGDRHYLAIESLSRSVKAVHLIAPNETNVGLRIAGDVVFKDGSKAKLNLI